GHADHQAHVAAEVGRPPVLRTGHQVQQVLLQRRVVELAELLAVVEVLAQRIGALRVLGQQVQAQLVRPPVAVGGACAGDAGVERSLLLGRHWDYPSASCPRGSGRWMRCGAGRAPPVAKGLLLQARSRCESNGHRLVGRGYQEKLLVANFPIRSEEHTSELQSRENLVCRLLLEKKKQKRLG